MASLTSLVFALTAYRMRDQCHYSPQVFPKTLQFKRLSCE